MLPHIVVFLNSACLRGSFFFLRMGSGSAPPGGLQGSADAAAPADAPAENISTLMYALENMFTLMSDRENVLTIIYVRKHFDANVCPRT